jgi:pyrroline-5-carboxylate reductase
MASDVSVGLIGAGRLGAALGRSFEQIWCRQLPVWSRRFSRVATDGRDLHETTLEGEYRGLRIESLQHVAESEILLSAIPNLALTDLARDHSESFQSFFGVVFLAGADTPPEALHELVPRGLLVRLVPVILPGRSNFVFFVREEDNRNVAWHKGLTFLSKMGSVITISEDQAYEKLMILTSPFATVIRTALKSAIAGFLSSRRLSSEWQQVAERVTALSLSGYDFPIGQFDEAECIATPGGITEAGLEECHTLAQAFFAVIQAMQERADTLSGMRHEHRR